MSQILHLHNNEHIEHEQTDVHTILNIQIFANICMDNYFHFLEISGILPTLKSLYISNS